jgi:hypothetical protein
MKDFHGSGLARAALSLGHRVLPTSLTSYVPALSASLLELADRVRATVVSFTPDNVSIM